MSNLEFGRATTPEWDEREMPIPRGHRQTVFERDCCDPNIVLRNRFSLPRQVRFDSSVVVRRALAGPEYGANLQQIFDLPEALGLKSRVVSPVKKLAQSRQRQIDRGYFLESLSDGWGPATQMLHYDGGIQQDATSRVHLSVRSLPR